MKSAQQFVDAINSLEFPLIGDLPNMKFETYEFLKAQFRIQKSNTSEVTNEPLVDLVNNFDLVNFNVSSISFCEKIIPTKYGFQVGLIEMLDFLIIDGRSGKILVVDGELPDKIIFECAENQDVFTDALLELKKIYLRILIESENEVDDQFIGMECERISKMAGSDLYVKFYRYLFGI